MVHKFPLNPGLSQPLEDADCRRWPSLGATGRQSCLVNRLSVRKFLSTSREPEILGKDFQGLLGALLPVQVSLLRQT